MEQKTPIQTLLYRTRLLLEEGRSEAALTLLQGLETGDATQQKDIAYFTGWAYVQLQQWKKAIYALAPLSEEINKQEQLVNLADRERLAHYLLQLGVAAINLSHFDDAAKHLNFCLKVLHDRRVHLPYVRIHVRLSLATTCLMRGLVSPAIEHYEDALRLCRHYEDEDTPADIYHGLSMAHVKAGDYIKAYNEAQKALTLYKQKNNVQLECRTLNILGYVCQLLRDFKEASDHYTESLALASIHNGPTMVMMNCSALAYLRMAEGRLDEARRYCDMALTAVKRSTVPHLPGSVYHVVAKVAYKEAEEATGEHRSKLIEESIEWFEKSIAVLKETQANTELAEVCGDYANMLEDLGRPQEALESWRVGYESLTRSRGALTPSL